MCDWIYRIANKISKQFNNEKYLIKQIGKLDNLVTDNRGM